MLAEKKDVEQIFFFSETFEKCTTKKYFFLKTRSYRNKLLLETLFVEIG